MTRSRDDYGDGMRKVAAWIGTHALSIGAVESARAIGALLASARKRAAAGKGAVSRAGQTRKMAVVLFADIVGFTALAERLDPEYVTELVNSLWEGLDLIVIRHGGTVDKHMGDAVMATWGTPASREDDAERAVRCALEMGSWLAEYADRFTFSNGEKLSSPLAMRIGMHAGLVLYGPIGTVGETSVMGDSVNTASRIQTAAEPGTILVSGSVFRATSGIFDYEDARSIMAKGKTEAVEAYRVLGAKGRPARTDGRGLAGIHVDMVGRDRELETLLSAYLSARLHIVRVAVVGDPGIGKSRLLREFLDRLELSRDKVPLLMARCLPSSSSEPYGVLRSLVAGRLGLTEGEGGPEAEERFRAGFEAALRAGGADEAFAVSATAAAGAFLGLYTGGSVPDDPRTLAARAVEAARAFLLSFAPYVPLVIVEDAHWADAKSLEALLSMCSGEGRLMLLATARPSVEDAHPGWLARFVTDPVRLVRLEPLGYGEVMSLARSIFHGFDELPGELETIVRKKAEGNPYFVEELARMLIEGRAVVTDGPAWRLDLARLESLRVPDTLTGILQARIDSLEERDRLALMGASVIGRTFWDGAVVAVLRERLRVGRAAFSNLQGKELVFPRGESSMAGLREYVFKHALLRDVAYANILMRDRPRYHENAARWIIEHSGGKAEVFAGTVAEHFDLAGRTVEAARWYVKAANKAAAAWDNASALRFIGRALELAATADPPLATAERYAMWSVQERLHFRLGERERQAADLDGMAALAAAMHEGRERTAAAATVLLRRSTLLEVTGDYDAAFTRAAEAAALAEGEPETARAEPDKSRRALVAESLYLRGRAIWRKGDIEGALGWLRPAVDQARALGLRNLEAEALRNLGAALFHRGDVDESIRLTKEALDLARLVGNDSAAGSSLNNLGDELRYIGRYDEAVRYFAEALGIHRRSGERWAMAIALLNLALTTYRRGDPAEAGAYAAESLECATSIGYKQAINGSGLVLGNLALDEGEPLEALELYARSRAVADELGNPPMQAEARVHTAKALVALGRIAEAVPELESSMDLLLSGNLEGLDEPFDILLSASEILDAAGDPRGRDVLRAAAEALTRTADRFTSPAVRKDFLEGIAAHAAIIAKAGAGKR